MEHKYALWGFDDINRPVAQENLTIDEVNGLRDEKDLRTYHINPMQGNPEGAEPSRKPPANRSFVRKPDGSYERVSFGRWVRETYHFSDIDTSAAK